MSPQTWGTKVHYAVKQSVEALRVLSPEARSRLQAELSVTTIGAKVPYGTPGSTRLNIFEDRSEDMQVICVYDIKTGNQGITAAQLKRIAEVVVARYNGSMFFIIEVRPRL